jgi:deoxyribodipyrimidine photo-lyase
VPTDTSVLWLRRDLRLADNPALVAAAAADELLPVYCFDPREYGDRPFGGRDSFRYLKTGPHRVRFRREAVADLRDRLRRRDSDLLVRHGRPERVLPAVVDSVDADTVQFHTFPTPEEMGTEALPRRRPPDPVHTDSGHLHPVPPERRGGRERA